VIPIWRSRKTTRNGERASVRGITAIRLRIKQLRGITRAKLGDQMKKKSKFSKLATQLKKEGADDPKALAAWIGRKNLGAAEFMRRQAAGRKKAAAK